MFEIIIATITSCFIFPVLGVFWLLKRLVCIYVRIIHPNFGRPLEGLDVAFTVPDPKLHYPPSSVLFLLNFQGHLDLSHLQASFYENVVRKKNVETGCLTNPALQQFLVRKLGYYFWAWDSKFRIENHIRQCTPGKDLKDTIADLSHMDFEEGKSPWEIQIAYDVELGDSSPALPCTCLIFRYHHAMGDGKAIIKLLFQDFCSEIPRPLPQASTVPKSSVYDWINYVSRLTRLSGPKCTWTEERGNYAFQVDFDVSRPVSLSPLKERAKEYGTNLPVLIMASMTMGLRQQILKTNCVVPEFLTCIVPVPVPGVEHPDELINHFSVRFIHLPLGLTTLDDIIHNLNDQCTQDHNQNTLLTSYKFSKFIGCLPSYLPRSTVTFSSNFSNVAGPSQVVFWNGHVVKSVHVFALGSTDLGLKSYALSYNGHFSFCLGLNSRICETYKISSTLILEDMVNIMLSPKMKNAVSLVITNE